MYNMAVFKWNSKDLMTYEKIFLVLENAKVENKV